MESNKVYKAVELLRVSTTPQATFGTSLDEQAVGCERIRAAKGITLYKTYREDGKSGALYLTREDVQAAIRDIEEGRANVFITYRIDRAGRDVDVLRDIRKRVLAGGGRFIVDGMEFPDDSMSDLMFTQLASFAEWERKVIRERTVNGRKRRAEDGQQPCRTQAPYGLHVVTKQDVAGGLYPSTEIGKYQHVAPDCEWAQRIYTRYAAGTSVRQIRKWLRAHGVLSPEGHLEWSNSTLRRMLSNPAYKGEPAFGRTRRVVDETRIGQPGRNRVQLKRVDFSVARPEEEWIKLACEPLVTEEVWNRCQERLRENQTRHGGNPKRKTLLGGMVVCPVCKRVAGGSKQKTGRYYACPHDRGCKWRVNAERAEKIVTQGVLAVAQSPELAQCALRAYQARKHVETDERGIENLKTEIADLNAKEGVTVEAQLQAMLKQRSTAPYDAKLDEIAVMRAELEARLATMEVRRAGAQEPPGMMDEIAQAIASVAEVLNSPHLSDVEKNEILSAVVYEVRPNADANETVLALRPFGEGGRGTAFFVHGWKATAPRMLMRVREFMGAFCENQETSRR